MEASPRFASIDIGTNTIKLLIVERTVEGRFVPVLETSRTTRLGEGVVAGRLWEAAIRRTLDGLREFVQFCEEQGVTEASRIAAVGTAALRDAVNREEFLARAREIGLTIEAIPGEEEARLSFLAVRRDPLATLQDARKPLLVIDIGGGSSEVILSNAAGTDVGKRVSVPLGAVRLTESFLLSDPPTVQQIADAGRRIEEGFAEFAQHTFQGGTQAGAFHAVGVGGTIVNLASVKRGLAEQKAEQLHGTLLNLGDVEQQVNLYASRTKEQRKEIVGLSPARADIILGGALILSRVMTAFHLETVTVSTRGLRWGVLYDRFGTP